MSKQKKIGILTFHSSENYGSVLQAYALSKKINDEDSFCCEIIDYSNKNQRDLYAIFLKNNSIKNIIKNVRAFLNYSQLKRRKQNFSYFINSVLPVSQEKYYCDDDLKSHHTDYDLIICGSDQIWNPQSLDFSLSFFGIDFSCRKAAYAPSIRNASVNDFEPYKKQVTEALKSFSHISVREIHSIPVLQTLTDKEVCCVCDPTLLLKKEDYNQICTDNKLPKDYIFYYSIDYNHESVEMVKEISNKLNKPVMIIFSTNKTYSVYFKGFQLSKNNAPGDFINLVKHASLVLSTSFHGVAFSVIYRKNFFALKTNGYTDSRIDNLLKALNLSDRYIEYNNYDSSILTKPVSYNENTIHDYINHSIQYLNRCLNDS